MSKAELVDWFIIRQSEGFFKKSDLTVKELIYVQDHILEYADKPEIIKKDSAKIRKRLWKGETLKDVATDYHMDFTVLCKYLKKY